MIPSIRRRLVFLLIAFNILSLSLVLVWVYRDAAHEVEELFDANLAQSARVLLGLAIHPMSLAVIFGLFSSTVLTLIIVPFLYKLFTRDKREIKPV